jgi:hypothetical protein
MPSQSVLDSRLDPSCSSNPIFNPQSPILPSSYRNPLRPPPPLRPPELRLDELRLDERPKPPLERELPLLLQLPDPPDEPDERAAAARTACTLATSENESRMRPSTTLLMGVPGSHSNVRCPLPWPTVTLVGALPVAALKVLPMAVLADARDAPHAADIPESDGRGTPSPALSVATGPAEPLDATGGSLHVGDGRGGRTVGPLSVLPGMGTGIHDGGAVFSAPACLITWSAAPSATA